jgi:hypothetical protein
MKLRFVNPDQILGVVLALIVLGIGVFASFTVFANIPSTEPVCSAQTLGNVTYSQAGNGSLRFNGTDRFIPAPNFLNNTAVCVLYASGTAGNSGGFDAWHVVQTVGACNGTFIANGTYRTSQPGFHNKNESIMLHYAISGQQTSSLENTTFYSILNVSATSTQVFNIVGVVLILAAIMAIVGLVYSYIKPRM